MEFCFLSVVTLFITNSKHVWSRLHNPERRAKSKWPVDYLPLSLHEIGSRLENKLTIEVERLFEAQLAGRKIRVFGAAADVTRDEVVVRGELSRPRIRLRGIVNRDVVDEQPSVGWILADGVIHFLEPITGTLTLNPSRVAFLAANGGEQISFDGDGVAGKTKPRITLASEVTSDRSLRVIVMNAGAPSRFAASVIRCVGAQGKPTAPWDLLWLSDTGNGIPAIELGRNETARIEVARPPDPRPSRPNEPEPGRELYFPRVGGGSRATASRQDIELTVLFDEADSPCQLEAELWVRTRSGNHPPDIRIVGSRYVSRR